MFIHTHMRMYVYRERVDIFFEEYNKSENFFLRRFCKDSLQSEPLLVSPEGYSDSNQGQVLRGCVTV